MKLVKLDCFKQIHPDAITRGIRAGLHIAALLLMLSCGKPAVAHGLELQKHPNGDELKIMSFNIRQDTQEEDTTNNWKFRKESCIEMLNDQRPSVVGFQEAKYASQWLYLLDQMKEHYDGYGVGRDNGSDKGETEGILWRKDMFEAIDMGTFWLSPTPEVSSTGWGERYRRCATWALLRIKENGKVLAVFNTHFGLVDEAKMNEARILGEAIAKCCGKADYVVATGDFNLKASEPYLELIGLPSAGETAPVTDRHFTSHAWCRNDGIIDHIFYSPSFKAIEYHTVTEPYGGRKLISDHYPIYAILHY